MISLVRDLTELDRERERADRPLADPAPVVFLKDRSVTPRRITGLQIVCGNCMGDERLPRKTFLAAEGGCATCGGRSYELASTISLLLIGRQKI